MKTKYFLLLIAVLVTASIHAQNTFPSTGSAGIGTTTPNASSALEIKSTTQGILIPRMTKAQRDAIISPAAGLMIYQTNSNPGFFYYSGTAWTAISTKGANTSLSNLVSPTAVNQNLLPLTGNTFDLGSSDYAWRNFYPVSIKFPDGTAQTTGYVPYTAGTGISISGTSITNTLPDQVVSITGAGTTTVTGTYPNFTISSNTGNSWNLNGNAGTDTAANFIGTTDLSSLAFKVNNIRAGYLAYDFYDGNTAFGCQALNATTVSGGQNTAVGYQALSSNTGGGGNVAVGHQSLERNTGGHGNTAIGRLSLSSNTSGNENTASGYFALGYNYSGSGNTATGIFALLHNTTQNNNTAFGDSALCSNGTGASISSDGINNVGVGFKALVNNTTGRSNTAMGYEALFTDSSGFANVAIGADASYTNKFNNYTLAIGDSALYNNGKNAVQGSSDANANVAVGSKALFTNTTGRANSAFGYQAAYSNSTGIHNTAVGYFALRTNITGSDNTTLGYSADVTSSALSNSTAIGSDASVSASNCVVLGSSSVTKMGVGTTPSSANIIQFAVTTAKLTTGGVWTNASDKKLKDQFEKLDGENILGKINQLDIERWHYKADQEKITHIGPVAQDFYQLFRVGDDTTISTIDPSGVALLGIQALKSENDSLKSEMVQLKMMIQGLQQQFNSCNPCARTSVTNNQQQENDNSKTINISNASLEQNIPNPFSSSTAIHYTLPQQFSSAQIIITAQDGKVLKRVAVNGTGKGMLNVDASTLASGAYSYSLIIDGKLIDTKKMMLSK